MKTIKEINKKFDELFKDGGLDDYGATIILKMNENGNLINTNLEEIKSFYTKQILVLIEELEGKLPKKQRVSTYDNNDIESFKKGRNKAIDQMRASIREFFEIKD